jgi:type I restriction-modification system DNA methylase subunit
MYKSGVASCDKKRLDDRKQPPQLRKYRPYPSVGCFRTRVPQGRSTAYSRKVSMDEIEKNGYNLNISRYISTAEYEVQIDMQEVNAQLASIHERIRVITDKHNGFLRELGLG